MKRLLLIMLSACMCFGMISCTSIETVNEETLPDEGSVSTEGEESTQNAADDNGDVDESFSPSAKIVNKDGAKGVVSYVIDDGYKDTARFTELMLDAYESLTVSFALSTKNLATLETKTGSDGKLEYVKDANGKYVYTVNQTNVDFWKEILSLGRTEIISHTHSHTFWGTNDDGGVFNYVKTDGTLMTSENMPKGSSSKELFASKQIIQDLFSSQRALSFVDAGIGVRTGNTTANTGEQVEGYKNYFNPLLKQAIKDGEYIGSRGTFQATSGFEKYVNTRTSLKLTENRMNVQAFMILNSNAGTDIINWKNYIDKALEMGGWACFCIHQITASQSSAHHILQSQARQLFKYTEDLGGDVWVATFTDAMLYFSEWSTAKVKAEYSNRTLSVKVTDEEIDSVYNMPLTVKVTVPSSWSGAKAGNESLTVHTDENGDKFVYVNAVPDGAAVQIVKA